ncbi:hypothetical protein SLA2020_377570 [Shorea laevis]
MADPALHQTQPIKHIAIDYTPEACTHCPVSNSITLTYDHRGGAMLEFRSKKQKVKSSREQKQRKKPEKT